jgi:hypothetical protein
MDTLPVEGATSVSRYGGIPDTSAERERRFARKRNLKTLHPADQARYEAWYEEGSQWWRLGILSRDELDLLDSSEEATWVTAKHIAARHSQKDREVEREYQADRVNASVVAAVLHTGFVLVAALLLVLVLWALGVIP